MLRVVAAGCEGAAWFDVLYGVAQTAFVAAPEHYALRVYGVVAKATMAISIKQHTNSWSRSFGTTSWLLNGTSRDIQGPNELATLLHITLTDRKLRRAWYASSPFQFTWQPLEAIMSAEDCNVRIIGE